MFFILLPILGIAKDVIDENYGKLIQLILKTQFIRSIKVVGTLVSPKGIIINS